MEVLPFTNEFAKVIDSSGILPGLYKECAHSNVEILSKLSIDLLALSGIAWNVAHTAQKHGEQAGLKHGVIILLLAYIIPNLTMDTLIHTVSGAFRIAGAEPSKFMKALIGCVFIGVLLLLERFVAELAGVHGSKKSN